MLVTGNGSEVIIANGGGGNGGGPGYIAIGSAGAGSLTVSEGALVENAAGGYTFVGLEVGSTGELILQGDAIAGALFDAGEALVVGAGYNFDTRSEEHTSELQSLMRIPYA